MVQLIIRLLLTNFHKDFSNMGKDFKNKGGFGKSMYQSPQEPQEEEKIKPPTKEKPPEKKRKLGRQAPTKSGLVRYSYMADPELLDRLREISAVTNLEIRALINSAVEEYLKNVWTRERLTQAKTAKANRERAMKQLEELIERGE